MLVLAAALAVSDTTHTAAAQTAPIMVDDSVVCSTHHKFGAQPVDVAKTADGAVVLAVVSWSHHPQIGCYLTLDETAVDVLRRSPFPSALPYEATNDSRFCATQHQFGRLPVDVAKSEDRANVLARLVWNWHEQIGCYLTLDSEAVRTLRADHAGEPPEPVIDPTPDPTPEPDECQQEHDHRGGLGAHCADDGHSHATPEPKCGDHNAGETVTWIEDHYSERSKTCPQAEPDESADCSSTGHPERLAGWVLDCGENSGGAWWSYDRHADPSNPDASPLIAVVCADNRPFAVVVQSRTPVSRSNDDESVAVSYRLGNTSGDGRWWAADSDEYMSLSPPGDFAVAMQSAGSATLSLDVTDDRVRGQSLSFDLTGFAEVAAYHSQHCPAPVGWQRYETENDDGAIWGYQRYGGQRDGNVWARQVFYVRCYADNTDFDFHVWSDTPVTRSTEDESVAVSHRISGVSGQSRWWAHDYNDRMVIFPPTWLLGDLVAAGNAELQLDVTDTTERKQSMVFDMTGFATSVKSLAQRCPVPGNGGSSASGAITVLPSAPSGRCASAVSAGVYQWESCAWADYWQNRQYNRPLSEAEAQALIARIWDEVDVAGKPAQPPTSEIVPAGSDCATSVPGGGFIIGCYQSGRHHIRRLDSFLQTLLHEVAHALVRDHPTVTACQGITDNDDYQACAHNDIFRCVADHLYVRYAGILTAGVCGTATQGQTPGVSMAGWDSRTLDNGNHLAWVNASWHTRPSPYDDSSVSLGVRCATGGELDVFFWFDEGLLLENNSNRISVTHLFLPEGYSEWSNERQSEWVADNHKRADWVGSTTDMGAFLLDRHHEDFISDAVDYADVVFRVWNPDGSDWGLMAFSLRNAYTRIKPVTENCGWRWGNPSTSTTSIPPDDYRDTGYGRFRFSGSRWSEADGYMTVSFIAPDTSGQSTDLTVFCPKSNLQQMWATIDFSGQRIALPNSVFYGSILYNGAFYVESGQWRTLFGGGDTAFAPSGAGSGLRSLLSAMLRDTGDIRLVTFGTNGLTASAGVPSDTSEIRWFLDNSPY